MKIKMKVDEFASKLGMRILTGEAGLDREVRGAYTCDLLSWVMSHADKGDAWITVHTHLNVVAVALLTEISCVIVPEDIGVEEATLRRAQQEGIPILGTGMDAFGICCKAGELLKPE
jgi:predicted transcriptional regulator